jgi:hypothetical protein
MSDDTWEFVRMEDNEPPYKHGREHEIAPPTYEWEIDEEYLPER